MGETAQNDSAADILHLFATKNFEESLTSHPVIKIEPGSIPSETVPIARVKRKRVCLSLKQKLEILRRLDKGEKPKVIAKEYNIGTSSIGDLKVKKDSILKYAASLSSADVMKKRKTMRNPNNKKLDELVYEWYQDMKKKGHYITGPQICEKALELNNTAYGSPDFKASSGWLKNFKSRHGIDFNNISQSPNIKVEEDTMEENAFVDNDVNSVSEKFQIQDIPQPPKRKRVCLSLKQKVDIIKKLREGVAASDLAREYNIGSSSVFDIKMRQSSILKFVSCFQSIALMNRRKTMKLAFNKELDEAVYKWYQETTYSGKTLTGPAICEKALLLNKKIGGSADFKASNGWLKNFKSRHGLEFKEVNDYALEDQSYAPRSPEDWTLRTSQDEDLSQSCDASMTSPVVHEETTFEKNNECNVDYYELINSLDTVIQWAENLGESAEEMENLIKLREKANEKVMSVAFSSDESEPINRSIGAHFYERRDPSTSLDDMYEIQRCTDWIKCHNFSKVALQFPDSLLKDSAAVALKLEELTRKEIFILGDTSYGSCCVDEVAADHVSADCIIHFGHACLSLTKIKPVLYIFGKHLIDTYDAANAFHKVFQDEKSNVIILYEVMYSYAKDAFLEQLRNYENVILSKLEIPGEDSSSLSPNEDVNLVTKNHRIFRVPKSKELKDYDVFYIGTRSVTMTNFMLTLPDCKFYSYNPYEKLVKAETLDVNKHLKRRYFYIEKAKDANIIGILVGTLGVSNYLATIDHLKELIKNAGKKSYTLVVGKLNNAKLANFAEIDVFVNVACIESSLIECRDFYQPIVTPYELEISLNQARKWTGDYVIDFSEILPGAAHYVPLCNHTDSSDVSLVTGKIRLAGLSSDEKAEDTSNSAIATRDKMEISAIHSNGAGEFLQKRSWKGLEQKLGETISAEIEEGQHGIASAYNDEMNLQKNIK